MEYEIKKYIKHYEHRKKLSKLDEEIIGHIKNKILDFYSKSEHYHEGQTLYGIKFLIDRNIFIREFYRLITYGTIPKITSVLENNTFDEYQKRAFTKIIENCVTICKKKISYGAKFALSTTRKSKMVLNVNANANTNANTNALIKLCII